MESAEKYERPEKGKLEPLSEQEDDQQGLVKKPDLTLIKGGLGQKKERTEGEPDKISARFYASRETGRGQFTIGSDSFYDARLKGRSLNCVRVQVGQETKYFIYDINKKQFYQAKPIRRAGKYHQELDLEEVALEEVSELERQTLLMLASYDQENNLTKAQVGLQAELEADFSRDVLAVLDDINTVRKIGLFSDEMIKTSLLEQASAKNPQSQNLQALRKQFGREGLLQFTKTISENLKEDAGKFLRSAYEIPRIAEFQKAVQDYLIKNGILEESDQDKIIDLERLKAGGITNDLYDHFKTGPYKHFFINGGLNALALGLREEKVYAKDEYGRGGRAKDLFLTWKDKTEAFNPEAIKEKDDFHLLPNDLKVKDYKQFYPGLEDEEIRLDEVILAFLAYHPSYGNGYREPETNQLMVKHKGGEYKPITLDWLWEEQNFYGTISKDGGRHGLQSVRDYVRRCLPNLMASGLVTPDHFYGGQVAREKERILQPIIRRSGVMIDQVRYTMPANLVAKGYLAVKLSRALGGVVIKDEAGQYQLTHTFSLLNPNDPRLGVYDKTRPRYKGAKLGLIGLKELGKDIEYQEPGLVKDFSSLLELSNKFSLEAEINLAEIDFREQIEVVYAIKELAGQEDRVMALAKKYGLDGLRIFSALEYGTGGGEKILDIGERISEPQAKEIFSKCQNIIQYIHVESIELSQMFYKDGEQEINQRELTREFLKRVQNFIDKIFEQSQEPAAIDYRQVINDLDNLNAKIVLFCSFFKTAYKNEKGIGLQQFRDIDFVVASPDELAVRETNEMRAIISKNYSDPSERDNIIHDLEGSFKQNDITKFYIIKYQNKTIGFIRFMELANGDLYAGTFNIDPSYHDSALGRAMLDEVLEIVNHEAKDKNLRAYVNTKREIGTMYIEKIGFVGTGIEQENGLNFIKLMRPGDSKETINPPARISEYPQIVRRYEQQGQQQLEDLIGAQEVILKLDIREQDQVVQALDLFLNQNHYVLKRYFKYPPEEKNLHYYVLEKQ